MTEKDFSTASESSREGFDIGLKISEFFQEKVLIMSIAALAVVVGLSLFFGLSNKVSKFQLVISVGQIAVDSGNSGKVNNRYKGGRIITMLLKNNFGRSMTRSTNYIQHVDHLPANFDALKMTLVGETPEKVTALKSEIMEFLEKDFEESKGKVLNYHRKMAEVTERQISFLDRYTNSNTSKSNGSSNNDVIQNSLQQHMISEKVLDANLSLIELKLNKNIELIPNREILFGRKEVALSNRMLFVVISSLIFGVFFGVIAAQIKIWRRASKG